MNYKTPNNSKILTVAICAYNMEKYIDECLCSLLIEDISDIEILIMNDGSTDNTPTICRKYTSKYPDSVRLIDKINGGWGSNINIAVTEARGKYFKILDADDWFDSKNFSIFVNLLKSLDTDMVVNNHVLCYCDQYKTEFYNWQKYTDTIINLSEINDRLKFNIWDVTFKTDLINKGYKNLPNKCLYTDTLFLMRNLSKTSTAFFSNNYLYMYRLGREGQSISKESVKKHYKEMLHVLRLTLNEYKDNYSSINRYVLEQRLMSTYAFVVKNIMLLHDDKSIDSRAIIISIDKAFKQECRDTYEIIRKKLFKPMRITHYNFIGLMSKKYTNL